MKRKKILICGGHLTPAVALIEELQKSDKYSIWYVGRLHALEGDPSYSLEYTIIKNLSVIFIPIITGRFSRHFGISSVLSFMKIPVGFIQAAYDLLKLRPDVIVSFGGYVSFPVGVMAYLFNIPLILDEQTQVLGLSNRILSYAAEVTFLSSNNTKLVPKGVNTQVIGIPRRSFNIDNANTQIVDFGNKKLPLIFISGGSQGSRSINTIIRKSLPKLLLKYRLLHQCGEASGSADFKMLQSEKKKMSSEIAENYHIFTNCSYHTFFFILKSADLVIGRSGANTVSDLSDLNKKSIFIPLPWSGGNEQLINAQNFLQEHVGFILEQKDANPEKLMEAIENVLKMPLNVTETKKLSYSSSAASYIVQMIHSL